jgi:hypothetical protein
MSYIKEKLIPGYTGKFVIQRHLASHEHFDLRLEFPVSNVSKALADYSGKRPKKGVEPTPETPDRPGTVLRSWAIPKHKFPGHKPILATETENHHIAYQNFKGTIPEGQYGAGTVTIVDKGTYTLESVDFDKKYVFTLKGKKHPGTYALIKTDGKSFLWLKTKKQKRACISLYVNKLASAIDYPRPMMNPQVWDLNSGFPPKLRQDMKEKLLSKLFETFNKVQLPVPQKWITGIYLSGSMTGNIAQEHGDVDVDIEYEPSRINKNTEELKNIIESITHKKIEGTELITAYMILVPGDHPISEGVYDIQNDRWVRGPILIPTNFDPDTAFALQKQKALKIAQEIDILIRKIYRAVKDLKKIDDFNKLYGGLSSKRIIVLHKLQILCELLDNWYNWIWNLTEAVKDNSHAVYPAYRFGPNWDERYIILKYLGRYEYHNCIAMLYSLFDKDDPYLEVLDRFIPD